MASDPSHRAGDADRDAATAVLREAFAEGRLSQEEFSKRLDGIHEASTVGEVTRFTADLPVVSAGADRGAVADYAGQDLTGVTMRGAHLARANLAGAILVEADLTDADLSHADLTGADLSLAKLTRANLSGASLVRADLTDAVLKDANLTGADLSGAHLSYTDLNGATLTGAILTGSPPERDRSEVVAARRRKLRAGWTSWLGVSVLVNVIWFASWVAGGSSPTYYWPIWVMGPWGAVMVLATLTGRSGEEGT